MKKLFPIMRGAVGRQQAHQKEAPQRRPSYRPGRGSVRGTVGCVPESGVPAVGKAYDGGGESGEADHWLLTTGAALVTYCCYSI